MMDRSFWGGGRDGSLEHGRIESLTKVGEAPFSERREGSRV